MNKIEMILVEGGTFMMGSDSMIWRDECPIHPVTLDPFEIGKYPVTQRQWEAVMGNNPSYFKDRPNNPVENVTWDDTQEFIKKLNDLTGLQYRLPTEAEWEYAARGGIKSQGYEFSGSSDLKEVAWMYYNSGRKIHPVGKKRSNELGIYDMSGNVWEWCQDWYGEYPSSAQTNPKGPDTGTDRVNRGGSWLHQPLYCRVVNRNYDTPGNWDASLGFRLARSL